MNSSAPEPSSKPLDLAIAGETNLDLILYGLPENMPLERELLGTNFNMTLGGSSSILAHNLSILGARVGFTSQLGTDDMGDIALKHLAASGLDTSHISRHATGTGVTLLLPHGSRRHILTYPGIMAQLTVADLDLPYLTSARHFHLSSLFLQTGLHPDLPELFNTLKAAGLTLSLDTNDDPADQWSSALLDPLLDKIDLLLPNEDELLKITRQPTVEQALDALSPRIPLIVVKCGSRGAIVQRGKQFGNQRDHVAPVLVTPIDTIGAGDSFNAGFLHSYLRGDDPVRAAAFGNLTGALSTQRPGGTEAFRDATLRNNFLHQHAAS
ncbi:MAG: sugar kinase [Acidobacteriaceae bacterium]